MSKNDPAPTAGLSFGLRLLPVFIFESTAPPGGEAAGLKLSLTITAEDGHYITHAG
jgi:hypothetical protein